MAAAGERARTLIETHAGVPIVPLPVLEKFYPHASDGLKVPDGVATIGTTRIVFVDFSRPMQKTTIDSTSIAARGTAGFCHAQFAVLSAGCSVTWPSSKGMTVSLSFNNHYDKLLPLAKGDAVLVETHAGVPSPGSPVGEVLSRGCRGI